MYGKVMQEKSTEEYQAWIGYRDYWACKAAEYYMLQADIEEQIRRIAHAAQLIHTQTEQILRARDALSMLPDQYSLWKGLRAAESFCQCTEGELFAGYCRFSEEAQTIEQALEDVLLQKQAELTSVQELRIEADRSLRSYEERVAFYWM